MRPLRAWLVLHVEGHVSDKRTFRPSIEKGVSQDLSEGALFGATLLLYDLHLLFVHTAAMNLELGQSTVDLFQVFCGEYKVGRFDVLLKMLDLARSGDRNDERLFGQ